MFQAIVNLIKNPFYVKVEVHGKTLVIPFCMKLFYAIGYNPLGSNTHNLLRLSMSSFLQFWVTCGEIVFTHSVWGGFLMFTGLASTIFGARTTIVMGVIVTAHQKYKKAFFTFVQDIWINAEEDEEAHKRCEERLALPRLVCYVKMAAVATYVIEPLIDNFSRSYDEKNFPLAVDYWFVYRVPYVFEFFFLVNTFDIAMRIIFVANLDLIMNYYVVYTSARFDKLAEKILDVNSEESCSDFELRKKISVIIQTHNNLCGFVQKLQGMFTVSLLMQFIADVFVICVLGAQLAFLALPVVAYGRIATFLATVYAQQYVNSASGEMLSEASMKLGDAAYHSGWVNKIQILGPSVALIIQYSQRPLILSGCGFFDLNMLTFSAVCRRSLSYFMLLRTLFE